MIIKGPMRYAYGQFVKDRHPMLIGFVFKDDTALIEKIQQLNQAGYECDFDYGPITEVDHIPTRVNSILFCKGGKHDRKEQKEAGAEAAAKTTHARSKEDKNQARGRAFRRE